MGFAEISLRDEDSGSEESADKGALKSVQEETKAARRSKLAGMKGPFFIAFENNKKGEEKEQKTMRKWKKKGIFSSQSK